MTVLNSLSARLKAELIFDPSTGVLQNETLMRMVLSSILMSPDDGQLEQFFMTFTYITTKVNSLISDLSHLIKLTVTLSEGKATLKSGFLRL